MRDVRGPEDIRPGDVVRFTPKNYLKLERLGEQRWEEGTVVSVGKIAATIVVVGAEVVKGEKTKTVVRYRKTVIESAGWRGRVKRTIYLLTLVEPWDLWQRAMPDGIDYTSDGILVKNEVIKRGAGFAVDAIRAGVHWLAMKPAEKK